MGVVFFGWKTFSRKPKKIQHTTTPLIFSLELEKV